MARSRVVELDGPGVGLSEEEVEQKAAGDIALLDDPIFNAYKWSIWRLRTADEMAREPQGGEWEHVATKIGQLDEDWVHANLGGGTFEFRGYYDSGDGTGRTLKRRPVIALAGPRKNFSAQPTPQPATVVATPTAINGSLTRGERIMLKMFKAMNERVARIESTPAASVPPPVSLKDMAETLKTLKEISGPTQTQRDPDVEVVKTYVGMIQQGIELGREREPLPSGEGNGGPDWGKIAETGMQLLDKLLARATAQRVAQRRAAAGHAPSQAAVVDDSSPVVDDHRWETAFESLAGAITDGEDPSEFAVTLARILNKTELAEARFTPEKLVPRLQAAGERFPVLLTEPGQVYVNAVLMELNRPDETEPTG
jgi:hypothetical protein